MKKIVYIYALLSCGMMACSKDYLERLPESSVTPEASFKTEKDLALFTKSFYDAALPSAEGIYNESVDNIVKTTLDDELTGKRQVPISGGGWTWANLRNINYFLANCFNTVSETTAAPYAAEARFFRAYFYFDKLKRFGDVPWYDKVIDQNDEEQLKKARDPRTLVVSNILADLDYAIANLSATKSDEKVTKWTALALKSRVALFEGTFRKYHTEFNLTDANGLLEKAADAASKLMEGAQYSVYNAAGTDSYGALFYSVNSLPQEVILARKFSDALQIWHNVNYYTITASYGKPGLDKNLVDSYLMKDGTRFTDKSNYQTMMFKEEVLNRDPRLSQTIRTPGYKRIGGAAVVAPNFGNSVTGYQLIKFVGDVKYDNYNRSENDMPIFRYGEVLLNYAEAQNELSGPSNEVLASLNQIRTRANMPSVEQTFALNGWAMNQSGLRTFIRHERRIELAGEGLRYFDILRWKIGEQVLQGPIYTVHAPDGIASISTENGHKNKYLKTVVDTRYFNNPKFYVWPIPQSAIDASKGVLVQNPLWK